MSALARPGLPANVHTNRHTHTQTQPGEESSPRELILDRRGFWYLAVQGAHLIHYCIRIPSEIVVWIYATFDNNFEIVNAFTKYLNDSCRLCITHHFPIKYFSKFAFACKMLSKLQGYFRLLWVNTIIGCSV